MAIFVYRIQGDGFLAEIVRLNLMGYTAKRKSQPNFWLDQLLT